MKIYVYSENTEIIQRLVVALSAGESVVQSFSSLQELTGALESESSANLIYHLPVDNSSEKNAESKLEGIQKKFKEKVNTLVVTNTPNPEQGVRLLNLNVRGYANTYIEKNKLIMAISVIDQGEIWAGAALIQHLLTNSITTKGSDQTPEQIFERNQSVFQLLTGRERQIAQKILSGLQNKLIADELSITERTVKAHLSAIYKKLDVRNRLELTIKLQQADRRNERVDRRTTL